jgi:PhzF family phenazine biosynthesis protein
MLVYQVDAFTDQIFKGNPAAVCPLKEWISEELMQSIAEENNLSETVFFVEHGGQFDIRWFTPTSEIDLCGHGTLAAGHIIYTEMNYGHSLIEFNSKSGRLTVKKKGEWYTLNFPSEKITEMEKPSFLESALNSPVLKTYKGKWKYLVELESEFAVQDLIPNFGLLSNLDSNGIIVTAEGNNVDFVSRFFAPKIGINEDPVTGSAHTLLIPHWGEKLNKTKMLAMQLSKRTGFLKCEYLQDRVEMSGQAITYLKGTIDLNISH